MTQQPDSGGFFGLAGKRVIVTGGASGIGHATALRFAAAGSRVVILDRDEKASRKAVEESPELVAWVRADVSQHEQVQAAFAEVDRLLGGIDVLVANAGISERSRFLDIQPTEWRRVVGVNLDGVFFCLQEAARRMVQAGAGVLLMTGSTNGLIGHPYYAHYNAAKAGVILLAKTLALELAPTIRVNAVCPGYVLTPMQKREYSEEMLAATNRRIPLGRHATPEEIADLFVFLASDAARYVTGQAVIVDGGEMAGGVASRFGTVAAGSTPADESDG